ncbi:MAG: hypothetical protein WCF19_01545 [Chlamydiales bacterium]
MNTKRTIGVALIVIGAIMLLFSNYIADQVLSGKMRIASAQNQVDTVNSVFSMSKYTKPVGKQFTGSAQKQINAGQEDIDKYESMANNLKIGGVTLIVIGIAFVIFSRKKR